VHAVTSSARAWLPKNLSHPLPARPAAAQELFSYYMSASGYGNADKAAAALQHWGGNRFDVPAPPFMELLKEQLMAPFFVFQARAHDACTMGPGPLHHWAAGTSACQLLPLGPPLAI